MSWVNLVTSGVHASLELVGLCVLKGKEDCSHCSF